MQEILLDRFLRVDLSYKAYIFSVILSHAKMFFIVIAPIYVPTSNGRKCPSHQIPVNIWCYLIFIPVWSLWNSTPLWFSFLFPWLLVRLGIFSYDYGPLMFSFIQQILFEYLPCAKHCLDFISTSLKYLYLLIAHFSVGMFFRGILCVFWRHPLLVMFCKHPP